MTSSEIGNLKVIIVSGVAGGASCAAFSCLVNMVAASHHI